MLRVKIGFLGCGNMASAVIDAFVDNGIVPINDIYINTRTMEKADKYFVRGAVRCESAEELGEKCDFVFICVKPQQADEPLHTLKKGLKNNTLIISMLAGKRIFYFKGILGEHTPVIRIMPNTPCTLGYGAVAMSCDGLVDKLTADTVKTMLESLGTVELIDEDLMDAIVAVNGSSPAYFYRIADVMADWAVKQGIERDAALKLAVSSMRGSAEMLMQTGKDPKQLIKEVSSPNGTTVEALRVFDNEDFDSSIEKAMTACMNRSKELSK